MVNPLTRLKLLETMRQLSHNRRTAGASIHVHHTARFMHELHLAYLQVHNMNSITTVAVTAPGVSYCIPGRDGYIK